MSFDLIIFDHAGLTDFPQDTFKVLDAYNQYVNDHQKEGHPTAPVKQFIEKLEQMFDNNLEDSNSPWAMWPPTINGNGRNCIFNLALGSDQINMMISFSDLAKKLELILIDPQGKNPLISAPWGGGLLD